MRNLAKKFKVNFIQDRGEYFGIVGAISITISVLISYLINLSVNPTFSVVSNCVSDLGTGPVISCIIFSVGFIITGFCQIPFYLSLVKYLRNKDANAYLIQITKLTFVISAIGLILLGFIPFERESLIFFLGHGYAAATHYVAGSFAFIFYGFFEILILKFSKILGILSFLIGIIYGILWVGYLIDFIFRIPQVDVNYTLQWISLAGILLWSLLHTIFLFKTKMQKKTPLNDSIST
jgi:hypothetical membrane protein